ncbi:uncharacterized protein OCT59_015395 [Rhizophagus irregularis]|nr:hypothetical protein OCT59_015395 [Rhizophagus irregularis]
MAGSNEFTVYKIENESPHGNGSRTILVTLNVGGVLYTTTKGTLLKKTNFFEMPLNGNVFDTLDYDGNIFIDQNGELFKLQLTSISISVFQPLILQPGLRYAIHRKESIVQKSILTRIYWMMVVRRCESGLGDIEEFSSSAFGDAPQDEPLTCEVAEIPIFKVPEITLRQATVEPPQAAKRTIAKPEPVATKVKPNPEPSQGKKVERVAWRQLAEILPSILLTRAQRKEHLRKKAIELGEDHDKFVSITEEDIRESLIFRHRMNSWNLSVRRKRYEIHDGFVDSLSSTSEREGSKDKDDVMLDKEYEECLNSGTIGQMQTYFPWEVMFGKRLSLGKRVVLYSRYTEEESSSIGSQATMSQVQSCEGKNGRTSRCNDPVFLVDTFEDKS